MNVDRPARPFAGAFIDWFAAMADLHNIMVIAPQADLDAVDFKFNIGGGALHGYVDAAGISIAAMWENECWSLMLDQDLVAVYGPEGWHSTVCPEQDRPQFAVIESVWVDHLFRPFQDWITTQLNYRFLRRGRYHVGKADWQMIRSTIRPSTSPDRRPLHDQGASVEQRVLQSRLRPLRFDS